MAASVLEVSGIAESPAFLGVRATFTVGANSQSFGLVKAGNAASNAQRDSPS